MPYGKNYIKIYFWQFSSLLLGYVSLFVVSGYISKDPTIFAIYSVVISITMLVQYGDMGVLSASQKYTSEYYARKEFDNIYQTVGFLLFITLLVAVLFSTILVFFAFNPNAVIQLNENKLHQTIAHDLFLIAIIGVLVISTQRALQVFLSIRLEEYRLSKFLFIINSLKILFAVILFEYLPNPIILYFFIFQILNLSTIFFLLYVIKFKFNIPLHYIIKSIRPSKKVFSAVKKMAVFTLLLSIFQILASDMDIFFVAQFFDTNQLAMFAVAVNIYSYLRIFSGIIFSPFLTRFNHIFGTGNLSEMKTFFYRLLHFFSPLFILIVFILFMYMEPFILAWLGKQYEPSILICQIILLHFLLNPLFRLCSFYLISSEKWGFLYKSSFLRILIYWAVVFATYQYMGLYALVITSVILTLSISVLCFTMNKDFSEENIITFIKKTISSAFIPLCFIYLSNFILKKTTLLPDEKGITNIALVLFFMASTFILSVFIWAYTSKNIRDNISHFYKNLNKS